MTLQAQDFPNIAGKLLGKMAEAGNLQRGEKQRERMKDAPLPVISNNKVCHLCPPDYGGITAIRQLGKAVTVRPISGFSQSLKQ